MLNMCHLLGSGTPEPAREGLEWPLTSGICAKLEPNLQVNVWLLNGVFLISKGNPSSLPADARDAGNENWNDLQLAVS